MTIVIDVSCLLDNQKEAKAFLNKMIDKNNQTFINIANTTYAFDFIKNIFPMVAENNIINISNCKILNCDILISYSLDRLLSGLLYKRICFNNELNRFKKDEIYDITRCNNFSEILEEIFMCENGE